MFFHTVFQSVFGHILEMRITCISNPGPLYLWPETLTTRPQRRSFKAHIHFLMVCVGKATSVLLTLLIWVLGSPLSNHCCGCAGGIVLQSGYQVVNRLTDACGESFIHGITSKIPKQRAGLKPPVPGSNPGNRLS